MVNDVDPERLRRLAGLKADGARVISIYLDLDPESFAAPDARASEIRSVVDAARRMVDEAPLDHQAKAAARADVERVAAALEGDLDAKGAHGLAVFACGPHDLFEQLKLPRPVATHVAIDRAPWIEPLVSLSGEQRLAVALVDRHNARVFHGAESALEEVPEDEHHVTYRTTTDDEDAAHLRIVGDRLLDLQKRRGFDALILGARDELRGALLETLHPYVRDRVRGDVDVDLASATLDQVRGAVTEALARLRERIGRGERAAAGLDDVMSALEQRRVETLLYERGSEPPGNAVELAVLQDAHVLTLDPHEHPDLGPHGGIAAVLRF